MNFAEVKAITVPEGQVTRIVSDGVELWRKSALPQGYVQKAYIQTDGGQYIDTGVTAARYADGLKYIFRGCVTQYLASANNNYFFGCYVNGSRTGNFTANTSTKSTYVIVGNQAAQILVLSGLLTVGEDITVQLTATSANVPASSGSVNGTEMIRTSSAVASRNTAMPEANVWLFGVNGLPTATRFCGKLYAFSVSAADGTPLRDFVPCERQSDGEIGLYDTVQGRFYQNAGSGRFTCA